MRRTGIGIFLAIGLLCGSTSALADNGGPSVTPQVEELQERMLGDEGIMALILSLQNDPEVQALLGDPAVLEAVRAGNIDALTNNPRFVNLLRKSQVKDIQKRLEGQGGLPR